MSGLDGVKDFLRRVAPNVAAHTLDAVTEDEVLAQLRGDMRTSLQQVVEGVEAARKEAGEPVPPDVRSQARIVLEEADSVETRTYGSLNEEETGTVRGHQSSPLQLDDHVYRKLEERRPSDPPVDIGEVD